MILLAMVLLAFLSALLSGGKLGRLANLPLRAPWLALLGFGLQIFIIYSPTEMAQGLFGIRTLTLIGSYAILLAFVWINRRLAGMLVIGLGLALNLTVMLANGGYMPITPDAVKAIRPDYQLESVEMGARLKDTKDILLPREETNLWFLADIFVLPPPFPIPSVFSPGDVVLAIGAFILILKTLHTGEVRPAEAGG
jgi:hypothetical protein